MGFITRAIGRQIKKSLDKASATPEGRAAMERAPRLMALVTDTQEMAGSGLDDEVACATLRGRLPEDPELVEEAIAHLAKIRTNYLDDRAYRLLTAAVRGDAVRPIDPAVRDQFLEEAKLGRMPLNDAFERLASLEPRLHDIPPPEMPDPRLLEGKTWTISSRSDPSSEMTAKLLGPIADTPHAILSTDLARAIVSTHLKVRARGLPDTDPTPFYERLDRTRTGTFFTIGVKRPRAKN